MWWPPFLSATPVVWVGLHLEQQSLFTRHFDVEYLQRTSSCVKSTISWHARHTYMTFVEEIHTYAYTHTHTHDWSQTQTSAWVLSAAALVHRNTGALALRSAARYTLLCKSDWDTQKDPVLSLRLPYKEQQSRLRESSSVLSAESTACLRSACFATAVSSTFTLSWLYDIWPSQHLSRYKFVRWSGAVKNKKTIHKHL